MVKIYSALIKIQMSVSIKNNLKFSSYSKNQRRKITFRVALMSLFLILAGIITGLKLTKDTTQTQSLASAPAPTLTPIPTLYCKSTDWVCSFGSHSNCANNEPPNYTQTLFNNTWCNGEKEWKYEDARNYNGNGNECGGSPQTLKSQGCPTTTPSSTPTPTPYSPPPPNTTLTPTTAIPPTKPVGQPPTSIPPKPGVTETLPTPTPDNYVLIQVNYKIGVCLSGSSCDYTYAADSNSYALLVFTNPPPRLFPQQILPFLDTESGFLSKSVVFSNKFPLYIGQKYDANAKFYYTKKGTGKIYCEHTVPTSFTYTPDANNPNSGVWTITTDITRNDLIRNDYCSEKPPGTAQGSSNAAIAVAIDKYASGELDAKGMSAFINQLTRTSGLQMIPWYPPSPDYTF